MESGDSRKDFIFSTTSNIFGKSEISSSSFNKDDSSLNVFLDDGNSSVLAVRLKGSCVTFSNKVHILCDLWIYLICYLI